MIHIHEILDPSRVFTDLKAGSKRELLREMTDRLEALGALSDSPRIHQLLMDREALMTTGVKTGFAFPHAFNTQFDQSFLTLGVAREGVNYEALDGKPVHFVFLLLGPPHHQAVHLRILARISRLTGQPDMLALLRGATTPEEIMELLDETERRLTAYPYKIAGAE